MKSCSYYGRLNHDTQSHCLECGTSFSSSEPALVRSEHRPCPRLVGGVAATIGFVFVASTALVLGSRIAWDQAVAEHGGPIGKPGIYGVGIAALFYSIFGLILVLPVLVAGCAARFGAMGLGISLGGLLVLASLFFVRGLRFLLPAYLIGDITRCSPAYYIGAAIQLGAGIWLLTSAQLKPSPPGSSQAG